MLGYKNRRDEVKYFEVVVDGRVSYHYQIKHIEWEKDDEKQLGIGYFIGKEEEIPDFIIYEKKILLSQPLKQVIEMYSDAVQFILVVLNNLELRIQKEYYMIEAPYIEALSEKTTYLKNGWIDRMCFSYQKISDYEVFHLQNKKVNAFTPINIYMNLDIVESILRREIWGMQFVPVLVEEI